MTPHDLHTAIQHHIDAGHTGPYQLTVNPDERGPATLTAGLTLYKYGHMMYVTTHPDQQPGTWTLSATTTSPAG